MGGARRTPLPVLLVTASPPPCHMPQARPLTHDLMKNVLEVLGFRITKVRNSSIASTLLLLAGHLCFGCVLLRSHGNCTFTRLYAKQAFRFMHLRVAYTLLVRWSGNLPRMV